MIEQLLTPLELVRQPPGLVLRINASYRIVGILLSLTVVAFMVSGVSVMATVALAEDPLPQPARILLLLFLGLIALATIIAPIIQIRYFWGPAPVIIDMSRREVRQKRSSIPFATVASIGIRRKLHGLGRGMTLLCDLLDAAGQPVLVLDHHMPVFAYSKLAAIAGETARAVGARLVVANDPIIERFAASPQ